MNKIFIFISCTCLPLLLSAQNQNFKFAFVSDTHIGNESASSDLKKTVIDINRDSTLKFTIISGDITEFGSDEELQTAKEILSNLIMPWYIIPGNHDMNWSESGGNSFRKIFGSETFSFSYGGYLFLGTNCGPNMRMGPGQVPKENLVWLDSTLKNMPNKYQPVIFVNHYPQDPALNNWFEVLDLLKKRNIQMILCGHGHSNHLLSFENIPAVMGRSNLKAKDSIGGYNIVEFYGNKVTFKERKPLTSLQSKWATVILEDHHFKKDKKTYFRPSYSVNSTYPKIKEVWKYKDQSDIGAGFALSDNSIIGTNTSGNIYSINITSGKKIWTFNTGGKVYSSPEINNKFVYIGSTDGIIYCLKTDNGKLVWKYSTNKPIVASPVIANGVLFIGSSDGHFRALNPTDGTLIWDYKQVNGFVQTKPLYYNGNIFFGAWGKEFYSLDGKTGSLNWKWDNGQNNRMYSPAACMPVASRGKVFIVAPDRYMTAFNANSGKVLWRKYLDSSWVRESMGLSNDSSLVFVKTMQGEILGISTGADSMQISWKADLKIGYELDPAPIIEKEGIIFVPSNSGSIYAVDRKSGKLLWVHKISNSLINPILPLGNNGVIVSSTDGTIVYLKSNL